MGKRIFRFLTAWVWVGHLAVPVLGQAPAVHLPAQPEQPVVRVTTPLVRVNVIVQDKKGNPVADLNGDDFVLLDQGQEQPIRIFWVESSQPLPAGADALGSLNIPLRPPSPKGGL